MHPDPLPGATSSPSGISPLAGGRPVATPAIDLDADYVHGHQRLVAALQEIRRDGPTAPRLLRCSIAARAIGDYQASVLYSDEALLLEPGDPEACYERGVATWLAAAAGLGALPRGPGTTTACSTREAVVLLHRAHRDLLECWLRRHRDEEAAEALASVEALLRDPAVHRGGA